jgi:hypothetical protein
MTEQNEAYGAVIRESIPATADGTGPLPLEAVRHGRMHVEPAEMQKLVFHLALPQPGAYMTDALDVPPVTADGRESPTSSAPMTPRWPAQEPSSPLAWALSRTWCTADTWLGVLLMVAGDRLGLGILEQ